MIKCCYKCVPPKRTPTCHAHCPEYARERAEEDARLAAEWEKKCIENGLVNARILAMERVMKEGRRYK